jgi:hypothetical protein
VGNVVGEEFSRKIFDEKVLNESMNDEVVIVGNEVVLSVSDVFDETFRIFL